MKEQNTEIFFEEEIRILVFKTNIYYKKDYAKIASILNSIHEIMQWNIDKHDIDNVLRIKTKNISACKIIEIIQRHGYFCEELPD